MFKINKKARPRYFSKPALVFLLITLNMSFLRMEIEKYDNGKNLT